MNRLIIVFIALATISVAANAQFFAEWSMGLHYNDNNVSFGYVIENQNMSTDIWFLASPTMGYQLNDNFSVGTKYSFATKINKKIIKDESVDPNRVVDFEKREPRWSFDIFCRYNFWRKEKLSFLFESSFFIGGGKIIETTDGIKLKTNSSSSIGIYALPLVTYDLSDKFTMIMACDFLKVSFSSTTDKNEIIDFKVKNNNFGLDTGSILINAIGSLKIGFIYNF